MFVACKLFQPRLIFADEAWVLPQGGVPDIVIGSGLTHKHKTKWEKLAMDKHSGLLRIFVNYSRNFFITFGPGPNVIKLYMSLINDCSLIAKVFIPVKPFRHGLIFRGKARSNLGLNT